MASPSWTGFAGSRLIAAEELEALREVLESRTLYRGAGFAPPVAVERGEAELAALVGRKYAILMNSGTSALHSSMVALGVQPGDEVILPGFGWLTDVTAILQMGAVPVFAPLKADLSLDPEFLPDCRSNKTRVIAPIHACGRPSDLRLTLSFAHEHGLRVIEDVCQCLGGKKGGRLVGAEGDFSIFSFQAFKIVTCGEGGALATDDEELYLKAFRFHDAGLARFSRLKALPESMTPLGLGLNLRMSELTAALLRVQLGRLPRILELLKGARQNLLDCLEDSFATGLLQACPLQDGIEENGTFLILNAVDAKVAQGIASRLNAEGFSVRLTSEARLHALPGWIDYLSRNGYPFRAIRPELSKANLERTLTVEINWQLEKQVFEAFGEASLRALKQI